MSAYFAVFFGAVFLRVDYFPLTWVPMYGERPPGALEVTIGDLAERDRGFRATLADGSVEYVNRRALNMPPANFRRLYSERMFGEGPPQHGRERSNLSGFNQWWYERLVGPPDPSRSRYQQQVLHSVNETLGRRPGDPDYVVQLEARVGRITIARDLLDAGAFHGLAQTSLRSVATAEGVVIVTERDPQGD